MNDKLIINSISKIYFSITSFFIFIFLTLSVTFLLLSKGIYLKELNLPTFHINKLYLKWDEKLNISIDKLTIFTQKSSSNEFQTKDIRRNLKSFGFLASFLQSFIVQRMDYRDIKASLRYLEKDGGYIRASSSNFNVDIMIHKTKKYVDFEILNFKDTIKKIDAHGNIILDLVKRELLLDLKTDISHDISLNIYTFIDAHKLQYAFVSKKDITSIKHLVSIFNLNKVMKYWIYDAIKMQSLRLNKAYGFIDFSKPEEAFSNLYVRADVKGMEYKYHANLDAIHTQTTNLEFTHGVLNIRPQEHTTYGFDLNKSWLKIDFNKDEFELTLYLLLDAVVDKNFLYLLNTYHIKLPFIQNSGTLATDLTLKINLMTLNVDAHGTFYTDKSNFTYLGLNLDFFDTYIKLDNFNIVIEKMFAKYKQNVSANIEGKLDVKHNIGTINFDIKKANFKNKALSLNKAVTVQYNINNGNDTINVSPAEWQIYNKEIMKVEGLEIPFNYENLFASIPSTQISIGDIATIYTSGSVSFKTLSTNLEFDLAKFEYPNIKLNQSNLLFDLSFLDSRLLITSNDTAKFTIFNQDASFYKPSISFYENILLANSSKLMIENLLSTEIDFNYSTLFASGYINVENLIFKNDTLGAIFEKINNLGLRMQIEDDAFTAECPELNLKINDKKDRWMVSFDSLKSLYKHSKILQKYNLNEGRFSIFKEKKGRKNIQFLANIKHQHEFISIENKLISDYKIKGFMDNQTNNIHLDINNKVQVDIAEQYKIKANNIGVNIASILAFLKEIKSSKNTETKNVYVDLNNSYIYFSPTRKALADKISLQYYNNIVTAQLLHKGAEAGFKLQNDLFYLYGKNFNDIFMQNIFSLSKFKGGSFDFSMKGSLDKFSGIMYLKNTTVIEYKLLNNILAFINTIPSLVTFSLPGYNQNGLQIKNSYINFDYEDSVFTLKDIYLNSKEMEILGKGKASYDNNTIDLMLNLKTDLGSAASKIPVVGYILFDKESISTSLKVSGALDNPKIESMLATDIIVAPLNIIKRTLLFPFKIFENKK